MHSLALNEKVEVLVNSDILRFLRNPIGFLFVDPLVARFKGKFGEYKVNLSVDFLFDQEVYRLIKDVTLPVGDETTQIDHLVVSPYGIFVIETKNMKGWIFGRADQDQWTQQFYRYKQKFRNPIKQNHHHVKVVQELFGLGPHQVHNVVVFVGDCTLKTPLPAYVVQGVSDLADFIRSKRAPVFAEDQVLRLIEGIMDKRLRPGLRTEFAHTRSVKRKISSSTDHAGVCPRCGGVMVVRTNRHSGERFLGCRRYPRCKGTRSLP